MIEKASAQAVKLLKIAFIVLSERSKESVAVGKLDSIFWGLSLNKHDEAYTRIAKKDVEMLIDEGKSQSPMCKWITPFFQIFSNSSVRNIAYVVFIVFSVQEIRFLLLIQENLTNMSIQTSKTSFKETITRQKEKTKSTNSAER